ncbi:MAG: ACP S-malonyltransferase [Pseudomonadota bacterium]
MNQPAMTDTEPLDLETKLSQTAFSFRGYNVENLGRTKELLSDPVYGPQVRKHLDYASELAADALKRRIDLVERVEHDQEPDLGTYGEAIALIMAASLAQLDLLREFHGIEISESQVAFGYSLGELVAVVASGMFEIESVLKLILPLARDAAELALDVEMGVVFCRGRELDYDAVQKHCIEITNEGNGTIGISSYLAPNTVLLLGQGDTIDHFKNSIKNIPPHRVHLKKNDHQWPPLHTAIVRQKNMSNRGAVALETLPGGFTRPSPPIVSCVTGDISYTEVNAREILIDWIDQPQQLWSVIEKILQMGVERIVHVGPAPNIIPATLNRLSIDVSSQLGKKSFSGMGMRAVSRITRNRAWLRNLVAKNAALLRAPFIEQVNLEDWLLENRPD